MEPEARSEAVYQGEDVYDPIDSNGERDYEVKDGMWSRIIARLILMIMLRGKEIDADNWLVWGVVEADFECLDLDTTLSRLKSTS